MVEPSPAAREATTSRAQELVTREQLLEALELLAGTPSRAGREAGLAADVCRWGRSVAPTADWRVQSLGGGAANLIATLAPRDGRRSVVFYTHLDTSLSGDPTDDFPLTGVADPPAPLSFDADGNARGLGLAVSKAPAACALTAFVALAGGGDRPSGPGVGLLLAAGGTHRAPSGGFPARRPAGIDRGLGFGVEAALRLGLRPDAVINVKGGASGVLREEPGALLLRLEVRDRMAPVPNRGDGAGAAVRAARVAALVEAWRAGYAAPRRGVGREIAADAGVGAIEAGLPFKPDILPAVANVYAYVVTLPEEDGREIVADLESYLNREMPGVDPEWSADLLRAHVYGVQPGATTSAESEVVRAARAAWEAAFGPGSADVRDYTGSTDGVIFRRHGIDTVRLGVTARATPSNPSVDGASIDDMLAVSRIYVDTLARLG